MKTINATFEDGVLKPDEPLNLPEHTQVRITIEQSAELEKAEKLAAMQALWQISRPRSKHMTRDELHERR